MMLSPMPGDCGICGSTGIFFYVDIDLKVLVCAECLNETRMAEIQLRAAGMDWPDGRIKEANP